jgi:hypothetical protein
MSSLSPRSVRVTLKAGETAEVYNNAAQEGDWRLIMVDATQPAELSLRWRGGGVTQAARVTVARGARICVYAISLEMTAHNLNPSEASEVKVGIADTQEHTCNVCEVVGEAGTVNVPLPSHAYRVRLELSDPSLLSLAMLDVKDGGGTLRSRTPGEHQPDVGVLLGGASQVIVTSGCTWRLIFTLTL